MSQEIIKAYHELKQQEAQLQEEITALENEVVALKESYSHSIACIWLPLYRVVQILSEAQNISLFSILYCFTAAFGVNEGSEKTCTFQSLLV